MKHALFSSHLFSDVFKFFICCKNKSKISCVTYTLKPRGVFKKQVYKKTEFESTVHTLYRVFLSYIYELVRLK